jgi:hypothetical protein
MPISSSSGIMFFDSGSRKLFRISQSEGMMQLSDVKGLNAYLHNNVIGEILNKQNPLMGYGLTGFFDKRFNELFITFRTFEKKELYANAFNLGYMVSNTLTVTEEAYNGIEIGDYILIDGNGYVYREKVTNKYLVSGNYRFTLENTIQITGQGYVQRIVPNNFTISYNEMLSVFVSLHSFTPWIYITNYNFILSPRYDGALYAHNLGSYGMYYGNIYDSFISFVVNQNPLYTKTFDVLSMYSESIDEQSTTDKTYNDHVDEVRFFNDYQNTGWIIPSTSGLYKTIYRSERDWNLPIPGDTVINPEDGVLEDTNLDAARTFKPRLRDKYLQAELVFKNTDDRKRILHSVKTLYRISAH